MKFSQGAAILYQLRVCLSPFLVEFKEKWRRNKFYVKFTQAVKLLQKFQQTNVIKEVRGKYHQFSEDSSRRYSFVTEPGPFNFVEEPSTVGSPLGTRERSSSCSAVVRGECTRESRRGAIRGSTFFGNAHALSKVEEEEEDGAGGKGKRKKARLTLVDTNSGAGKPSPSQVAEIWKELTLTR